MKILKLNFVGSYVSKYTNNINILRGQTIRVDDAAAEKLLEGVEKDAAENERPWFDDVTSKHDGPVDYDFTVTSTVTVSAPDENTKVTDPALIQRMQSESRRQRTPRAK